MTLISKFHKDSSERKLLTKVLPSTSLHTKLLLCISHYSIVVETYCINIAVVEGIHPKNIYNLPVETSKDSMRILLKLPTSTLQV